MNRRRLLQSAGVVGMASLAGCPDTGDRRPDSAPTDAPVARDGFDRAVNVADAGADTDGSEPIDDLVAEQAARGGLLVFPDGEYRLGHVELENVGRFGMVAEDGADPTILPASPASEMGHTMLEVLGADSFLFEGISFDFREEGYGGRMHVMADRTLAVRNLRVRGTYPPSAIGFHFGVTGENGRGLVENLVARGGGRQGGRSVGVFVDRTHAGELTFRNCHLENFPNNGLYASASGNTGQYEGSDGRIRVLGGFYRNNNIAGIRIGGPEALVRRATIVVDDVPPHNDLNARGLLVRNGTGHRIEECNIVVGPEAGYSLGAVAFNADAGRATFRDSRIVMNRNGIPAVFAPSPSKSEYDPSGPVFENVSITGRAGGAETVVVRDRNRSAFRNCEVVQSGDNRAGIWFDGADDGLVADTTIDVTGIPIQEIESSVRRRSVNVVQP
ncbi:right-handed parallel beta-helix repeat-containing protein [Halorussus salilacus]|uniref:right-handed parallel beta-helix repeat-containing protein n=1 Tax=Halorussus salilacus TaxID=2953750 RepID=UPI0020A049C4|nr:right-handed parallel beta-helix repeat-containing protein [Halorussus salilacus]USZ67930.1 right-handed parallel beta-helix repeat-containing protein [Halorussus salilacus]